MTEAMINDRRTLHNRAAAGAFGQRHFGLGLWILLVAAAIGGVPAGAQTSGGGTQTPASAGGETNLPSALGGAGTTPAFPGAPPETLPPAPVGGFGLASPTAPPYSLNTEILTQTLPPTLSLLPPHAGIVPLQQYDPNLPAVLIQPTASLSEIFTDNVNYTHSSRKFAAITQLTAGSSVSVDTPRLQAVATGQVNGNIYLPGSNASLNQVFGSLYANGTATVSPDLFFVDLQSSISQSTTAPGFGFQNLSTLPRNQQTQQYLTNISPNLIQGVSSQGQFLLSSLATSTLNPAGSIVDQYTGLPTAFYNPGLGLTNSVYRQHVFNVGLLDTIGPNSYSLYGFYYEQQSLSPPTTGPTKTLGVNFAYRRDIRPDLSGYASLGYADAINSPTFINVANSSPALVASTSNFNTVTGSVGVNYVLGPTLTGSILYTLTYQTNGGSFAGGRTGDVVVNQLQFQLSKTF
jgi:hypothetical protein